MKHIFLTFAAALLTLSASALQVEPQHITTPVGAPFVQGKMMPESAIAMKPRKAAAADQTSIMNYTPASDPYTYTGFQQQKVGMKIAQAFQMTKSMTNKFAGNEISGIFFYTGINEALSSQQAIVNTVKKATLFLAYDLQNFEPFYTQTVDLPEEGLTLVDFELTTPYTIEAGKPFYVGYYYALSSEDDLTLIVDATNHGTDTSGGWFGVQLPPTSEEPNPAWQFDNAANQVGFFCLGAMVKGSSLPKNEVSLLAIETQPTVYQNESFALQFLIQNDASNGIESFDAEVKIGDDKPATVSFNMRDPLGYNKRGIASVDDLSYSVAALEETPVTVTITKINGEPNNSANASGTTGIQVIPTGKGFPRNVVVEEFTGTWCPACPAGIVTMESLRETYTDGSVILVAVHNGDAMVSSTYSTIEQTYAPEYPSAIMNRHTYINDIYPVANCVEEIETFKSYPAPAKVSATAYFNDAKTGIIFDTKTSFSFDNDKANETYILAFGVTEDNVGPYTQKNGYAGSNLSGWGDKPSLVETIYNDVARQYNSNNGIAGSIPASVEWGKVYKFNYEMKFLAASKISDKDKLNAVVYLINRKTKAVENACLITTDKFGGIEDVFTDMTPDADAPVEYFNLQGIRVAEPQNGIYLRRQGSNVEKIIVK